jgi:hypothetical protein
MENLRNNAAEFMQELESLGFVPGSGDKEDCRVLVRVNKDGHTDLRVCLVFGDENTLNNTAIYGLDGGAGEIIEWSVDLTGGAPLDPFLAYIRML